MRIPQPVRIRRAFAITLSVASLALSACSERGISSPGDSSQPNASLTPIGTHPRTIRDHFQAIARRAPGFAGLWIDADGTLVINVRRGDAPGVVESEAAKWLSEQGREELAQRRRRVNEVAYDYQTVISELELAKSIAARLPGVTTFGIDDREAKAVVGVSDQATAGTIMRALAQSTMRYDTWKVEVTGPAVDLQSNLQSTFSTIVAGIQTSGSRGACSIGLIGYAQMAGMPFPYADYSRNIYLTASHCTSDQYAVSGDSFGQPDSTRPVGQEIDEAFTFPQGSSYCTSYPTCRWADVAVVEISGSISHLAGVAAKSTSVLPPTLPPYQGNQNYTGTGVQGAIVGDVVTKVGRTTGQTTGVVDRSCDDRQSSVSPGLWTLCAQRASMRSRPGDSGAIVFRAYSSSVSWSPFPAGVLFQGGTNPDLTWFSPIAQIDYALNRGYVYTF